MLRLGREQETVAVVDDQVGCPSFAESVVSNTLALIETGKSGVYHLTSSGKLTWADFADEIFRQTQCNARVERITSDRYPTAAKRPHYSLLDCRKAAAVEGVVIDDWSVGLAKLLHPSAGLIAAS